MRRTMAALHSAVVLLLLALLYQQPSLAQVDPWERIKLIDQGQKVRITLHLGQRLNGRMESWTSDGLGVRQGKTKVVSVAKSEVAQVALVTGMSRGRKATYAGLIAGGVLGGVVGATCASGACADSDIPVVTAVLMPIVWGGYRRRASPHCSLHTGK